MKRFLLGLVCLGMLVGCKGAEIEEAPGTLKIEILVNSRDWYIMTFCDRGHRFYTARVYQGVAMTVIPNDPSCEEEK